MSSAFPLRPKLPLSLHHKSRAVFPLRLPKPLFSLSLSNSCICLSSSPSASPNPDREDFLWLREEQRWLREEQRWLREEQRWLRERESLLAEIQSLKLKIQALENQISLQEVDSVPDAIAKVGALLQVMKEKNVIAESGSSARPIVLEEKVKEEEKVVDKEVVRVFESEEKKEKRKVLRKGSEGEEVREMQVCLHFFYAY